MTPLQINYTGTWLGPVQLALSERVGISGVSINGSNPLTTPAGLWMENSFVYNEAGAPLGGLTTLELTNLVGLTNGNFSPEKMAALTSLSLPALAYVGGNFSPATMAALTSLSIPSLVYVGGNVATSTMASLVSLGFPALRFVGGTLNFGTMAALTSLTFPSLVYVGNVTSPFTMASLSSLSFPALTYCGAQFGPNGMALLTSCSAPNMVYYGSIISLYTSMGNVTSVVLGTPGTLKAIVGATINISGQKLNAASVNGILALLVSLDGTNGTTLWGAGKTLTINGGTNAAPSGQGILDKATLQARTATVTTN